MSSDSSFQRTFKLGQFLTTCHQILQFFGGNIAARGSANEIYAAFDACREKMDKQLRRYKRRLKDHHKERAEPVEFAEAPMYVLAANGETGDSEPETLQPMIIAEMETKIPVRLPMVRTMLASTSRVSIRGERMRSSATKRHP
mgnify:CR=1 FL=1